LIVTPEHTLCAVRGRNSPYYGTSGKYILTMRPVFFRNTTGGRLFGLLCRPVYHHHGCNCPRGVYSGRKTYLREYSANTNSTNFLVESLVAFAAKLRCQTFEMPASQKLSASSATKINIGLLPETLFHWYKDAGRSHPRSNIWNSSGGVYSVRFHGDTLSGLRSPLPLVYC